MSFAVFFLRYILLIRNFAQIRSNFHLILYKILLHSPYWRAFTSYVPRIQSGSIHSSPFRSHYLPSSNICPRYFFHYIKFFWKTFANFLKLYHISLKIPILFPELKIFFLAYFKKFSKIYVPLKSNRCEFFQTLSKFVSRYSKIFSTCLLILPPKFFVACSSKISLNLKQFLHKSLKS